MSERASTQASNQELHKSAFQGPQATSRDACALAGDVTWHAGPMSLYADCRPSPRPLCCDDSGHSPRYAVADKALRANSPEHQTRMTAVPSTSTTPRHHHNSAVVPFVVRDILNVSTCSPLCFSVAFANHFVIFRLINPPVPPVAVPPARPSCSRPSSTPPILNLLAFLLSIPTRA